MTKIILIMLSALLLSGISTFGLSGTFKKPPTYIFGEWRIYKFVEVGGHGRETGDKAEKRVGKSLILGATAFRHDTDLPALGQGRGKLVRYRLESHEYSEYEIGDRGSLAFYGLDAARENSTEFIIVTCGKQHLGTFEITKDQELAVYYDGWFFFLKKAKPGSKSNNI